MSSSASDAVRDGRVKLLFLVGDINPRAAAKHGWLTRAALEEEAALYGDMLLADTINVTDSYYTLIQKVVSFFVFINHQYVVKINIHFTRVHEYR